MAAEGRVLYNYNGEYKKGLLGKKKISAKLYEDYIEGTGAEIHIGELREVPFRLNISDIKKVEIKEINDNKCIQIEYVPENEEERARGNSKLLLPNVDKIEEAKKVLYDMVDKLFQEATRKALLEREKKEGAKKFYNEKMEAYGLNGETKYHKLMDVDKQYVGFYVDKSAVGVIAVDGQNQQDGKFSIAYDKVRYFGKIENVTEKYDAISQLEFDGVSIDISKFGGVVLTYKNVNGKYVALKLPADIYDELEKAIPNKEYSLVIAEEKAEAERLEAARLEAERLEAERIAKEKAEAERKAREEEEARLEAERIAKEKAEAERKAREEEEARLEAERIAKEKAEAERLEAERIAKEKAEEERLAKEMAAREEADRIAREKIEEEVRLAKEKAEREEAERLAKEKAEKEEAERLAKEKAEKEEAERLAKEKAEKEEAERLAKEKAEKEKAEEEARLAKEKEEAEKKQAAAKAEPADEMVAFEKRIKKLMIMKNTGILTEAEFEEEKKKLFDLL